MHNNKTAVIVVGVAGGASCASRLRRQDEYMRIILLERGPYVLFANCGLPYYIGGVIEDELKWIGVKGDFPLSLPLRADLVMGCDWIS